MGRKLARVSGPSSLIGTQGPPTLIDDDSYDTESRYGVDIVDDVVAAIVTQRCPAQPAETEAEIVAKVERIAATCGCRGQLRTSWRVPGGDVVHWPEGEESSERFRAETIESLQESRTTLRAHRDRRSPHLATSIVLKQPSKMKPYLVHAAIAEGEVEGAFSSTVRCRGEGSITMSAQQIRAYHRGQTVLPQDY